MFVHAADAANRGHNKIIIRAVDTDVVVRAVSEFEQLGVDELWLDFGVGKHRKFIASHLVIHVFHSFMRSHAVILPLFYLLEKLG